MNDKLFLTKYFDNLKKLISFNENDLKKIILFKSLLQKVKKSRKKLLIFGNGGSAAIASHFSVDLTKNAKVRCNNYNEADLITCFSNDYGYEHWVAKAIDFYGEKGDALILISSSGSSRNIVNACKAARRKKFSSVITLTGFSGKGKVSRLGDINFTVKSKSYNHIENTHQIILLSLVDLVIGKSEYKVNTKK